MAGVGRGREESSMLTAIKEAARRSASTLSCNHDHDNDNNNQDNDNTITKIMTTITKIMTTQ